AGKSDPTTLAMLVNHVIQGTGPNGVGWMQAGLATLPFMPPNANLTPKDATKLVRWVLTVKEEIPNPTDFVTESLAISGAVENPMKLTVEDLRNFPPQKVGEVPMVCQTGAKLGQLENLKGVLLRDLVEKAVVVSHNHNDVKKMAIIATASDGYKVVFSWSEIFNSTIGDGVLVYFEKDGKALGDDEGRIAMVSSKDIRPGPRHVKWLKAIEIRKIAE
ncbi:MAG: molybdopterin-dependent oxidoreductase, partial [Rhodoferax sp.]